jgi:hypothetical protein
LNKGQIVSGDFIVSIAIFLLTLAIIVPLFMHMSEDRQQRQLIDDMQTRLLFLTDSVLKTEGIPADWNSTNVNNIGFADADGRINKTKIRRFVLLDKGDALFILRLGGFQLNLSFYNGGYPLMTGQAVSPAAYFYVNSNTLFSVINNSGLVWDLYYGGSGTPEQGDARNVYTGTKADMFNEMVANASQYRTIIMQNPELTQGEVDTDGLKDFVSRGGILIFEGNADLISAGFSMHSDTNPGATGTVMDDVFIDAAIGSTINFDASSWYFYSDASDSEMHIIAENQATPGSAFIGKWNHGIGEICFITDAEGTVDGKNLFDALNIIGRKAEYATGPMENAVATNRAIVINTDLNSLGHITMVIGR